MMMTIELLALFFFLQKKISSCFTFHLNNLDMLVPFCKRQDGTLVCHLTQDMAIQVQILVREKRFIIFQFSFSLRILVIEDSKHKLYSCFCHSKKVFVRFLSLSFTKTEKEKNWERKQKRVLARKRGCN